MKLSDLMLLTNENISPRVVAFLREKGFWYLRLLNQSALNVIEVLKLLIAVNPVISTSSLVVINETRIRVRML